MDEKRGDEHLTLPERFVEEARQVSLGEQKAIETSAADVIRILEDPAMRANLRELLARGSNDKDVVKVIGEFLEDVAGELEDDAKYADTMVELIDRAGMGVAASVTAAGIGALVTIGATLGPIALLIGGLVGLAGSGTGRTDMKLSGNQNLSTAQKIRRFIRGVRETNGA